MKKRWQKLLALMCAAAMTVSSMYVPALEVKAEETALLKAGSISASDATITEGQPFAEGTADCNIFRIPCLITLKDEEHKGTLVAAADARYTEYRDFGGIDTIASVSTDNGKTWKYSFPIWFPDSNASAGWSAATTAIDPAIVEGPDGTIYCFADMNPTGITTFDIWPGVGTGYVEINGVQRLVLTDTYSKPNDAAGYESSYGDPTDAAQYEYYVGDFDENGYAKVFLRADHSESGYAVDEWYNLYSVKNGEYVADLTQTQVNSSTLIQQNAFYEGSVLHVYSTGYIWCVKSYDGGLSWEDPEILNTQIKRNDGKESALLVSPGQGMVTSDGDIVVGAYDTYNGENASIFYSTDNGKSWKRSNDISVTSSENEIVELPDGTLRMFYRSNTMKLCYADITKNETTGEYTVGEGVQTGIGVSSNCNVSAILLEDTKIDNKPVILASNPEGPGSWNRVKGRIFVFTVNEDNSMDHVYTYNVNEDAFAYSCMTEMDNSNIGMLWEPGINEASAIRFDEFEIEAVIGSIRELTLDAGDTYVVSKEAETKEEIEIAPDEAVATVTSVLEVSEGVIPLYDLGSVTASSLDSFSDAINTTASISNAEFTFQASGENWKIYNEATQTYLTNETSANTFFSSAAADMKVTASTEKDDMFTICKSSGSRFVIFHNPTMTFNSNGSWSAGYQDGTYDLVLLEKQAEASEGDIIPGYKRVSEITDGEKYLITHIWSDGSVIVLYPTNGTANQTKLVGEEQSVKTSVVTITAVAPGTTTAKVGDITYNISVLDPTQSPSYAGNDYPVDDLTAISDSQYLPGTTSEGPDDYILDGNANTHWHTNWDVSGEAADVAKRWVGVSLKEATAIDGIRYLPRNGNGAVTEYKIQYRATDDGEWIDVATGTWERNDANWKVVKFDAVMAKQVRIVGVHTWADSGVDAHMSTAEFRVTVAKDAPDVTETPTPTETPTGKTIELEIGETYKEDVLVGTAVSSEDETIAIAEVKETSETSVVLCDYNSTAANENIALTDAEMTFTAAEGENNWVIKNEATGTYFGNLQASGGSTTVFQQSEQITTVTPDTNVEGSFLFASGSRYTIFYQTQKNFNGMSAYNGAQDDAFFYELTLLEKQDTVSDTDVIPGYAKVSEITSGKTYLISYAYEGTVYVMYPSTNASPWNAITKSVNVETTTSAELEITAVAAGTVDVTVGENVYKVVVAGGTETPEVTPTETEAPQPTETEAPQPTEEVTPTETPEIKEDVTTIFDDVYEDWYTDYVQYVYDNNLMTGIKGTKHFEPNANITKAQVAQVLYNMEGQSEVDVETAKVFDDLSDVYEAEWYAKAVAWAYETGVVTGDLNAKKFFPNDDVTREQLALMMFRYASYKKYDVSASSDLAGLVNAENTSNWALEGVKWAVGTGLISGVEKDGVKDLAPQGNATRAQVAAILQRFCENVK